MIWYKIKDEANFAALRKNKTKIRKALQNLYRMSCKNDINMFLNYM